jgi:hypothetical protein
MVVDNCLQQLQTVGCFVQDLFKLRQLEEGENYVVQTTERLCRAHQELVYVCVCVGGFGIELNSVNTLGLSYPSRAIQNPIENPLEPINFLSPFSF